MARKQSLFVFLVISGISMNASAAAGGGGIMRGGLGFLFPDHNSFANPGQFSDSRAMAVEAFYKRSTAATPVQTATPSLVYGNGAMGLGIAFSRMATDLMATGATDTVSAGLGFSLVKGRATIGLGYDKSMGGADSGVVSGALTLNPPNRRGVALGAGYKRNLTSGTNMLTAGLGYSFMSNNNLEVNVTFPSLASMSIWSLGAYFTTMKGKLYLSGGYLMNNALGVSTSGVVGRLGFILGRSVDLSFWGQNFFGAGIPFEYGASFRAMF
jgi:hypothetical protein